MFMLCLAPCWNTSVFLSDSALFGLPRCSTTSCSTASSWAPCAFLTRHLWDASSPASPETWTRVRCLALTSYSEPWGPHTTQTTQCDLTFFGFLCVLFSLSIHLTIHSGRPSGHACWDAAPELDHGAFMPGHGVHHIPLVPALPLAPGSFPPHCQPRLQVRLQPINLDERDYVGCMCVSVHAYVCWLKYKKCRDGLGFCRSFG